MTKQDRNWILFWVYVFVASTTILHLTYQI